MEVKGTFNIRRYWLKKDTPQSVLSTLNYQHSRLEIAKNQYIHACYVDVNYYGESDRAITMMELRYGDWVLQREMITYTVTGDDGL